MTSPLDHADEIAACLAATGIDELELVGPGGRIWLRRGGSGAAPGVDGPGGASRSRVAGPGREVVASPGVGLFLRAHPLREDPLVRVGDAVAAGQALGLLRIGPLLVPVAAPRPGVVGAVPGPDGSLVGFGDPLFELEPSG